MRKFTAVLCHEYKKIVLKWTFLLGTLLFPLMGLAFAIVPAFIFSIKGEATRLVVVDPTDKILPRLKGNMSAERMAERQKQALDETIRGVPSGQGEQMSRTARQMGSSFSFVDMEFGDKPLDDIRAELNAKAAAGDIDAYLIIPGDIGSRDVKYEFRTRKAGDFIGNEVLKDALNEAVRAQRMADANIDAAAVRDISRNVTIETKALSDKGEEKDSDMLFIASLVIGMMIYISLAIYGQVIMGTVVEEKETRIAEILFSSARPFELMLGKLVGVGLAGLTQLGIWVGSLLALSIFLSRQADLAPFLQSVPDITPMMVVYFLVYFLIGYFTFAAIFALIGSAVTTVQEGSQFAFPPMILMLTGLYFGFAVIRDPNSTMSFWVSTSPFFAPLTMPVRILAEMPPFWQIALSVGVNILAIAILVWIASRVYRVGMLMYGKRATVPEIWKWIRKV
ncbi:MAG: ABC transporter permease [Acidobacteriota bacterium]|nr:MAG: ABC transporter permease [Acidobacteriota bacterium]